MNYELIFHSPFTIHHSSFIWWFIFAFSLVDKKSLMDFDFNAVFRCIKWYRWCPTVVLLFTLLNACAPQPPLPSPGHINTDHIPPAKDEIPPLIQQRPFVPPPQPAPPLETYTVVVDDVPVDQLLFALARDAKLNVDIYPGINGNITLNAIDQTLPQLLERIAKQIDLRYQIDGNHIIISPDLPYMRLYKVDYVNLSRDSKSEVAVSTQIISDIGRVGNTGGSGSASGENNSTTQITNESNNRLWETLEKNIRAILANHSSNTQSAQNNQPIETNETSVIVNPEGGIITVQATHRQHQEIQKFLDQVLANVQRQVLIEATIVEVRLTDQYQAGVDWQRIHGDFNYNQSLIAGNLGNAPFYSFTYTNPQSKMGNLTASVRLLEQFGSVKVLSSPKIMALNNQTAILKVVDNIVYFTTEVEINETETRSRERFSTEINTVPVGIVMSITPQVSETDTVILNIRPTISRIIDYKIDPNPVLAQAGTLNEIPQIQVREIESILKINNGEIAIIGGLMQDTTDQNKNSVPWLSQLPVVGDLFSYRNDQYIKTELVIFLRPIVVKQASLSGDLQDYRIYLPDSSQPDGHAPTGF
jgi:MSHA type pilus biogenesis protein MshL